MGGTQRRPQSLATGLWLPGGQRLTCRQQEGPRRVRTWREASWDHGASCIRHEQLCRLRGAILKEQRQAQPGAGKQHEACPVLETPGQGGSPKPGCGSNRADLGAPDSRRGSNRHACSLQACFTRCVRCRVTEASQRCVRDRKDAHPPTETGSTEERRGWKPESGGDTCWELETEEATCHFRGRYPCASMHAGLGDFLCADQLHAARW